jgi:hypothetical protein
MGIRAKARQSGQPVVDPWIDTQYIAAKYSVSRSTAQRWIIRLIERHITFKDGRFKRKERRMLRIPLSLLEEHIDEFLN